MTYRMKKKNQQVYRNMYHVYTYHLNASDRGIKAVVEPDRFPKALTILRTQQLKPEHLHILGIIGYKDPKWAKE